jgi:GNAT acetyltransferase-like protein
METVVHSSTGSEVVTARTPDEVEQLRSGWESFALLTVHHDPDYHLAKLRTRPEMVRPHVVLVERDGRPTALAIGRVEQASLHCRIGYRTVYRPRLRLIVMRPGMVFNDASPRDVHALMFELTRSLERGEADALALYGLDPAAAPYRASRRLPSFFCRGAFVTHESHYTLELPDSLAAFIASQSRHARSELRGVGNRLARRYGDRLSVRIFRSPNDLQQVRRDLACVDASAYQGRLRLDRREADRTSELMSLALARGWLRSYVLYLDGRPVAYWSGHLYRGRFSGANTGYDPAYARDRVGMFLFLRMVEDLCDDKSVQIVDYGCGDAEHKRRFASGRTIEAHPLIFAPTFTGLRANLMRTAIAVSDVAARSALERTRLLTPLRQRVRARGLVG